MPAQPTLEWSDLYDCHPRDVSVHWNSETGEVWQRVAENTHHRLLGKTSWVRGIANITFHCQVHKGKGRPRCGLILTSGDGLDEDFEMLDTQCLRWFSMAGAYRSDAVADGKVHHMAEAKRIKEYVKATRAAKRARSKATRAAKQSRS